MCPAEGKGEILNGDDVWGAESYFGLVRIAIGLMWLWWDGADERNTLPASLAGVAEGATVSIGRHSRSLLFRQGLWVMERF